MPSFEITYIYIFVARVACPRYTQNQHWKHVFDIVEGVFGCKVIQFQYRKKYNNVLYNEFPFKMDNAFYSLLGAANL